MLPPYRMTVDFRRGVHWTPADEPLPYRVVRYTDSIFVGVDALGDPFYRTTQFYEAFAIADDFTCPQGQT